MFSCGGVFSCVDGLDFMNFGGVFSCVGFMNFVAAKCLMVLSQFHELRGYRDAAWLVELIHVNFWQLGWSHVAWMDTLEEVSFR